MISRKSIRALLTAFCLSLAHIGQSSAQQGDDPVGSTADDAREVFVASEFGIVEFTELGELYPLLTAPGRCPERVMAPERQPCAFIFYSKLSGTGKLINFKPVFKVESERVIWVIHDKRLKRVAVTELYGDSVSVRGQTATYISSGIVGNAENSNNCETGRKCLSHLVKENMFLMYRTIPGIVVDMLWHNRQPQNGTVVR